MEESDPEWPFLCPEMKKSTAFGEHRGPFAFGSSTRNLVVDCELGRERDFIHIEWVVSGIILAHER